MGVGTGLLTSLLLEEVAARQGAGKLRGLKVVPASDVAASEAAFHGVPLGSHQVSELGACLSPAPCAAVLMPRHTGPRRYPPLLPPPLPCSPGSAWNSISTAPMSWRRMRRGAWLTWSARRSSRRCLGLLLAGARGWAGAGGRACIQHDSRLACLRVASATVLLRPNRVAALPCPQPPPLRAPQPQLHRARELAAAATTCVVLAEPAVVVPRLGGNIPVALEVRRSEGREGGSGWLAGWQCTGPGCPLVQPRPAGRAAV